MSAVKNLVLVAGMFVFVFLISCGKDDDTPPVDSDIDLFINEIHPTGGPDWLEIYNPGSSEIDLTGFFIYDDADNKYEIPSGISIPASGYLVFICDDQGSGVNTNFRLSSGGETVTLESDIGELIDQVTFPEIAEGAVYARFGDGEANFQISSNPTQGLSNGTSPNVAINSVSQDPEVVTTNDDVTITVTLSSSAISDIEIIYTVDAGANQTIDMANSGTQEYSASIPALNGAGEVNYFIRVTDNENFETRSPSDSDEFYNYIVTTDELPELYINEFMASNSTCCPDTDGEETEFDDWIEIYNASSEAIDIGGFYITDNTNDPFNFQIPDDQPGLTTIPAGGFIVLWADNDEDQGPLHLGFGLSADGEDISLNYIDGRTIDSHSFSVQTTDVSQGRISDGADTWTSFTTPTQGASNN